MTVQHIIILYIIIVIGLFLYLKVSHRYHWFDIPNEDRKIHSASKPTSAGLVFILPILILALFSELSFNILLVLSLVLVMLILGGFDDFWNLSSRSRMLVQLLVSSFLFYLLFNSTTTPFYLLLVYFIGIIWWINLYNFMDGADGMAILHAILPSCAYLYLLQYAPIAFIIQLLLVSLLAFLPFNFPKSKMFMGDSGSLSVAFLLAFFALYGISNQIFDPDIVFAIHLLFIIDATLTLLMRLKKGHKITQAHHLHLYQSLIYHGMSHWRASLIYAFISALIILLTIYLHITEYDLFTRSSVLLIEVVILTILWFKFIDRSRFELK
jgi:UDP-N-acetylmuramyl pentapeptide phosphotransferase/UDP-N-acetylglucosamine-1-phosphate transferase